eukprot:1444574-Alexandrium_andersonii.AAC.1
MMRCAMLRCAVLCYAAVLCSCAKQPRYAAVLCCPMLCSTLRCAALHCAALRATCHVLRAALYSDSACACA